MCYLVFPVCQATVRHMLAPLLYHCLLYKQLLFVLLTVSPMEYDAKLPFQTNEAKNRHIGVYNPPIHPLSFEFCMW